MKVSVDKKGRIDLKDLFTVKRIKKIASYAIDKSESLGTIRLYFYDSKGDLIVPILRKRGKARK